MAVQPAMEARLRGSTASRAGVGPRWVGGRRGGKKGVLGGRHDVGWWVGGAAARAADQGRG